MFLIWKLKMVSPLIPQNIHRKILVVESSMKVLPSKFNLSGKIVSTDDDGSDAILEF